MLVTEINEGFVSGVWGFSTIDHQEIVLGEEEWLKEIDWEKEIEVPWLGLLWMTVNLSYYHILCQNHRF